MAFDNLDFMSVRDRAGMQPHERLYNISSGPNAPGRGQEFAQVIAEAAGLNGEGALATRTAGNSSLEGARAVPALCRTSE